MIINFFKKNSVIIIILLIAFIVRCLGINYNLPLSRTIGDEIVILSGSLRMMGEQSLTLSFPHSNYLPLSYYLYLPFLIVYIFYLKFFTSFNTLAKIKELAILHTGNFLIIGRLISILFSIASVFLIYLISQQLFKNKRTSLCASLLFALSPLNVFMAHFARIWSIQVFFILLVSYFILKFFNKNAFSVKWKEMLILAILFILSFATHFVGLLVYIPMLVIIYFSFQSDKWKNFLSFLKTRKFVYFNLIMLSGISVSYFLNKTSFTNFLYGFFANVIEGKNVFGVSWGEKIIYYLGVLFQYEGILFFLLVPSFFILYRQNKKAFYFLITAFLSFYIFLGPISGFVQARYALSFIPFLILTSAYFINYVISNRKRYFWRIILMAFFLLPSSFLVCKMDKLFLANGPELSAYNWIESNIPAKSKILFINRYFIQDLIPTKESIKRIKKYSSGFYSSRMDYLLNIEDKEYPYLVYDVYQDTIICDLPKKEIEDIEFDYIFVSEGILEGVTGIKMINLCGLRRIELKGKEIVFEINSETFFDSDYSYSKRDPLLEALKYFSEIKKLGPRIIIYKI